MAEAVKVADAPEAADSDNKNRIFDRILESAERGEFPLAISFLRVTPNNDNINVAANLCIIGKGQNALDQIEKVEGLTESEQKRNLELLNEHLGGSPSVAEFCRVAAEEAALRGIPHLGFDLSNEINSKILFDNAKASARMDSKDTNCEKGFYVGFIEGITAPNQSKVTLPDDSVLDVKNLPRDLINKIEDVCFSETETTESLSGFVAGKAWGILTSQQNGDVKASDAQRKKLGLSNK